MNKETIEIHEFSTGIHPEKTANGGWISRGFTGQYMNMTLESVPHAVERSIANREFAVTEGASTDQPAIIGRVVGSGEDAWSVVAVVTRGRDEIGRSLSVYRYFLCEGHQHLRHILAWWESQNKPKFDPFDTKYFLQPNQCIPREYKEPQKDAKNIDLDSSKPKLLLPQEYDLSTVNMLACIKASNNKNDQPVSWAFNVEVLEQPRRFQVIQPASQRAYEILDREIKNVPQVLAPVFMDEEALKSAIRGLMNNSKVKPEAVQTIAEALEDEQITKEYWHSLFDGQGAQTAIKQKIYSPQMVRLITLRAMVIPETITEFLAWLNVKAGKKPDENQTVSLEFQAAIRDLFPKTQLADGIKFILPKLLEKEITPETVYSFLMVKGSAWSVCCKYFLDDIKCDLQLIDEIVNYPHKQPVLDSKKIKYENNIWENLIKSLRGYRSDGYYYKPLAELFEKLEAYSLAAYFYQISDGRVPKNIFYQMTNTNIFGLNIKPKVTRIEAFLLFFTENYVHFAIILLLTLLSFFILKIITPNNAKLQFIDLNQSIEKFDTTSGVIQKIITEIHDDFNKTTPDNQKPKENVTKDKIKKALNSALNNDQDKLDYAAIQTQIKNEKDYNKAKEKWVLAIYKYQIKIDKNNAYGLIDIETKIGVQTYEKLKQDIKNSLNQKSN